LFESNRRERSIGFLLYMLSERKIRKIKDLIKEKEKRNEGFRQIL